MDGGQSKDTDTQFISFHDFPSISHAGNTEGQLGTGASTQQSFNNLPNDSMGIGIMEDLQGMPNKTEGIAQPNFWTIEYYQKFFNVNTNDVLERLKRSMIPHGNDNYLITHIRPNPDLYGPFWTTNSNKHHWRYDFHIVSYAATFIFLYAWLLPLALWGAFKWTNGSRNTEEELIESYAAPGLLELLCLYGYSLSIYIPVAFLWVIQISWLQWSLVILVTFLSGGVLLRSLLPVIAGRHKIVYVAVILGMHLLLAAGFMLYFFHVPSKTTASTVTELVASSTHASVLHKIAQSNNSVVSPTVS
ncbi:protein YIPF2 isoform X2 [Monomorium pharaonis]|uniref:protein YIPF2 isoform X2 n=1 Tax=Monomorium pharaonis TaxID=307658 RepID=UPI00063FA92C|nr:protein YIPF2 isoform X2 [Monomorium pharaonis]